MKFFLLADSEIWYVWPETTGYTVLEVFIFILLFFLVVQVGRLIFLDRTETEYGFEWGVWRVGHDGMSIKIA
jgi:hypothetical protein